MLNQSHLLQPKAAVAPVSDRCSPVLSVVIVIIVSIVVIVIIVSIVIICNCPQKILFVSYDNLF